LSPALIIEQISEVDAKARELRDTAATPPTMSQANSRWEAKHDGSERTDPEAMGTALEGIEARAREICGS
jgi:hypothetical protein